MSDKEEEMQRSVGGAILHARDSDIIYEGLL